MSFNYKRILRRRKNDPNQQFPYKIAFIGTV